MQDKTAMGNTYTSVQAGLNKMLIADTSL